MALPHDGPQPEWARCCSDLPSSAAVNERQFSSLNRAQHVRIGDHHALRRGRTVVFLVSILDSASSALGDVRISAYFSGNVDFNVPRRNRCAMFKEWGAPCRSSSFRAAMCIIKCLLTLCRSHAVSSLLVHRKIVDNARRFMRNETHNPLQVNSVIFIRTIWQKFVFI